MDTTRASQVEALFDEVVELPPGQREAFLRERCGSDDGLRHELEALLEFDADVDTAILRSLVVRPASDSHYGDGDSVEVDDAVPPAGFGECPSHIGNYEIVRVIAEGGMGTVFEAWQESPRRTVALKTIRPGLTSPKFRRRFEQESLLLGRLQHPGIAQIYEAGTATVGDGPGAYSLAFFAMEFVRGVPLLDYAQRHSLGPRARLELMAGVCDAVHHAHEQGVVHRDLKPANILVNDAGHPKVLDFGVARATGSNLQNLTLLTDAGQLIGTVAYMSPEQVVGDSREIDTQTDVYALGVVLFELLAGRLPYDVRECPIPEAARVIRDEEPSHLSTVDSVFRGDVETIAAKAMEKEKERRYSSAAELAADIRRYLQDKAIIARPASNLYQLRKFAKRNKGLVGGAAATFLALLVGLIGMAWLTAREAEQHRLAHESEMQAQRNLELAERRAYRQSVHAAEAALERNDVSAAQRELNQAPDRLRGWEWHHFRGRLDDSLTSFRSTIPLPPMEFWVRLDVRMAPGGESLFLLSWRGNIPPPRWNLETFDLTEDPPKLTRSVPLHGTPCVTPDAGHVVFQGLDGSWHALDTQTGENRHIDVDESMQVADGQPLAVNARPWRMLLKTDDALAVVEPAMAKMHALPGSRAPAPWWRSAFSADASLLAYPVGQLEQTEVLVWDAVRSELLHTFRGYPEEVDRVAFSPDNRRLATVSADRTLRQWDLTTGKLSDWPVAARHEDRIRALAYSSDGRLIATGSQDRTVRVWSADTGMLVNVLVGHQDEISSVAFSPDDTHIASVSYDGQVRIWDGTRGSDARVLAGHGLYVYAVALSPDAARLASASWDGTVRVWDADTGDQVTVIPISPTQRAIIRSMVYRPTGAEIAVFEQDLEGPNESRVRVLDASTGISRVVFASDSSGRRPGMVFYPNGSHLAVSGIEEGQVVVFETDQYAPVARVPGGGACAVSFARRTVLAAATEDNRILLYDANSMQPMLELASHPQPIWSLAFSVDGCLLASGGEDDVVRLWDTATGEQLAVLRGHTDNVFAVAFSPDGTRIASGSNDQSIRLWDTESFEEVCHLHGHKEYVFSVTFSPDGRRLFSGSGDYTVRVWEIDPLRVRLLARQEREAMVAELRPVVHQLFDDYEEPSVVVARIENDSSFSDRRREVAFQIALAESVKRRDATLRNMPLP